MFSDPDCNRRYSLFTLPRSSEPAKSFAPGIAFVVAFGILNPGTGADRLGLPSFFCWPGSQSTPSIVHREHFRSFCCIRWHFALCLLQISQTTRRWDGWMSTTFESEPRSNMLESMRWVGFDRNHEHLTKGAARNAISNELLIKNTRIGGRLKVKFTPPYGRFER
jgi:hypothetical protein